MNSQNFAVRTPSLLRPLTGSSHSQASLGARGDTEALSCLQVCPFLYVVAFSLLLTAVALAGLIEQAKKAAATTTGPQEPPEKIG